MTPPPLGWRREGVVVCPTGGRAVIMYLPDRLGAIRQSALGLIPEAAGVQQILLFPLNFSVPPPLKVAGPDAILAAQFGRRKLTGFEHPVNDLPGGLQDVGEVGNGQKRTVLFRKRQDRGACPVGVLIHWLSFPGREAAPL